MKNQEVQQKTKRTVIDRYGVDNVNQSYEARLKSRQTNLARYGCVSPMQNRDIKETARLAHAQAVTDDINGNYTLINTLRDNAFWDRMKEDVSLKQLCDEFGVDYRSATSRLLHDEFRERYYTFYSFPRQQEQKRLKEIIESFGFETTMVIPKPLAAETLESLQNNREELGFD